MCLVAATVVLGVVIAVIGCGGPDLVVGGMLPPTTLTPVTTTTPGCLPTGSACSFSTDCCSGQCISLDGITLQCA
jgi:hypothetical protein